MADSYVSQTSRLAGAAAELAASRKSAKYADLLKSHLLQLLLSLLTWAGPKNIFSF